MKEIKYKNATVRLHGSADRGKIETATEKFARTIMHQKIRYSKGKEKTA